MERTSCREIDGKLCKGIRRCSGQAYASFARVPDITVRFAPDSFKPVGCEIASLRDTGMALLRGLVGSGRR